MPSCVRVWVGIVTLGLLGVPAAVGQENAAAPDSAESWDEDAWTSVVERRGLHISYIYYPEADNEHDGIVLRLENESETAVRYAFTVIFRAPEAETTATVQGRLCPGQMKTGDKSGLFWIPFKEENYNLGEIGIRGLEVTPVGKEPSAQSGGVPKRLGPATDYRAVHESLRACIQTEREGLQMVLHAAFGVPLYRRCAASPASRALKATRSPHFRLTSFD